MYQGEAFIGRDSMKGCAQKAQLSFHITCKIYFHMKARLVSEKVGIAHSSWQFLVFFLICYFFSCFLGALQMTNANIREINLTPHTGRLKVSSTNWEQRYTVNTLSKQSQYCLFVCWKGFEKKKYKKHTENHTIWDKLILVPYWHTDKRWPSRKQSSSSQLTFDTHKDRA